MLQQYDERNRDLIVNINGELRHRDQAGVSPFDSSVQGGDAVWEGLRVYDGRIFRLIEHLDRLRSSALALAFAEIPTHEAIIEQIRRTLVANQMRDAGRSVREAILEASDLRVRPVLMTSIATVVGALPLILGHGAGSESRQTIGVVVFFGLTLATMLTLFVVPAFYDLLARFTKSPEATARQIEAFEHGQAAARPAE